MVPKLLDRVVPEFLRGIPRGTALHDACVARAQEYAARAGSTPPFASPVHWAAFSPPSERRGKGLALFSKPQTHA